ncbi:hypothetical protein ACFJGW_01105 [Burkholderiaceae bacterium UC74_6]
MPAAVPAPLSISRTCAALLALAAPAVARAAGRTAEHNPLTGICFCLSLLALLLFGLIRCMRRRYQQQLAGEPSRAACSMGSIDTPTDTPIDTL